MISLSIEVVTTTAIALLSLAALKISTNITNVGAGALEREILLMSIEL